MKVYHGSTYIVEKPELILSSAGRDFGIGFYTTEIEQQAVKWAKRVARIRRKKEAFLNIYDFDNENTDRFVCVKSFDGYSMEWLDLIVACRHDSKYRHGYDIVTGKIANDDVGETVQAVVDGLTPKDFALTKLTYMSANNQICFCSKAALSFLRFIRAERLA